MPKKKTMNNLLPIKAVPIPSTLKDFDPLVGPLHMTESRILPNGLHRLKFTQFGRIPDLEAIKEKHFLTNLPDLIAFERMDEYGSGHAQLVWKENLPLKRETE